RRHRRRAPRRGGRAHVHRLRRGAASPGRALRRRARHRGRRRRARGSVRPADERRRGGGGRVSASVVYVRYELLRTFRNRRFFLSPPGSRLSLSSLTAGPNRHVDSLGGTGISAPLYYMAGLAAFGTMNAMLSTGARIAGERSVGWNRQLRLTPLSTRTYFRAKVLTAYIVAILSLVLLYLSGTILGVRLTAHEWVQM